MTYDPIPPGPDEEQRRRVAQSLRDAYPHGRAFPDEVVLALGVLSCMVNYDTQFQLYELEMLLEEIFGISFTNDMGEIRRDVLDIPDEDTLSEVVSELRLGRYYSLDSYDERPDLRAAIEHESHTLYERILRLLMAWEDRRRKTFNIGDTPSARAIAALYKLRLKGQYSKTAIPELLELLRGGAEATAAEILELLIDELTA